ncbi:MAG: uracil-DNA glycosylase [Rhodospirillales bacterium]|nr:uracil-DNA glycosylase [Rhodospirillales bacterium]
MEHAQDLHAVLQWHIDAGCDECIADDPIDRFEVSASAPASQPPAQDSPAASQPPAQDSPAASQPPANMSPATAPAGSRQPATAPAGSHPPAHQVSRGTKVDPREVDNNQQVRTAMDLAGQAKSVDDLRDALMGFEGCALKKTATNLVLSDGPVDAKLMFVGEAPGADEDRQGVPFVGPSGKLLNAMLESVGLKREDVLISNTVFWRPPGNRTPTTQESAVCHPFIERLVEIVDPEVLVCVGAPAAHTMLGQTQGISRLRGKWFEFQTTRLSHPIDATALFHPAYLLRTPIKKRDAWADMRMIAKKLSGG